MTRDSFICLSLFSQFPPLSPTPSSLTYFSPLSTPSLLPLSTFYLSLYFLPHYLICIGPAVVYVTFRICTNKIILNIYNYVIPLPTTLFSASYFVKFFLVQPKKHQLLVGF